MVVIRPATIDDCDNCVLLSEIEELKEPNDSFIEKNYLECFVDDDKLFLVAEHEGRIIGYALGEKLKGGVAFLSLLTVEKDMRNQGIGKQLIEAFRARCDEIGLDYIFLHAPLFNKNTIEFYKKSGFIEGKEYKAFTEFR